MKIEASTRSIERDDKSPFKNVKIYRPDSGRYGYTPVRSSVLVSHINSETVCVPTAEEIIEELRELGAVSAAYNEFVEEVSYRPLTASEADFGDLLQTYGNNAVAHYFGA
jgi:hypothetical protein